MCFQNNALTAPTCDAHEGLNSFAWIDILSEVISMPDHCWGKPWQDREHGPAQLVGKPSWRLNHNIHKHPPTPDRQLPLLLGQLHNCSLNTPRGLRADMRPAMRGPVDSGQAEIRLQRNFFAGN